jgi:hypothetical protein
MQMIGRLKSSGGGKKHGRKTCLLILGRTIIGPIQSILHPATGLATEEQAKQLKLHTCMWNE